MAHTISINVVDRTIPIGNNRTIPVINKPNPCYGYAANANEVRQLIQLSNYKITEAGTNNPITGNNYYEYFPEEQPGGGGGGGGVTPSQVEAMIADSIDASVSATSKNAIQNKVIKQYVDDNVGDKVDKVEGKGLSTNDYTTTEKTKLEDLADIQSIGDGLSLDNGELSASGSGGTEYAAGQGIAFSPVGFNPDPEYYFTSKVECKLGSRTFTKYNEEPAVAFVFTNSNDFSGPIYLGHTEDSVKFTQDYNYVVSDPDGSFEYQGYTWYYSHLGFFMPGSYTDSLGNLKKFTAYRPSEAQMLDMYKTMIDLARAVPSDEKAISAKLGEGLSFDDNDAIKVNGLSELITKVQQNENNISSLQQQVGYANTELEGVL